MYNSLGQSPETRCKIHLPMILDDIHIVKYELIKHLNSIIQTRQYSSLECMQAKTLTSSTHNRISYEYSE